MMNRASDTVSSPDIRIALLGLQSSGKTLFLHALKSAHWKSSTRITSRDRATLDRIFRSNVDTILNGSLPPASQFAYEYSLRYENHVDDSFHLNVDILDVPGEWFLLDKNPAQLEKLYADWVSKCNVIVLLLNGEIFHERNEQEIQDGLYPFWWRM